MNLYQKNEEFKYSNNVNTGFSLAEVLISLAVIGVIAALVLPNLIQNSQLAELKAALKADYSIISQATQRIIQDNNGSFVGLCNDSDHDCFKNLYSPYLNHIKDCNTDEAYGKCWHPNNTAKQYNGNNINFADRAGLILTSGAMIRFGFDRSDCLFSVSSLNRCGSINVDVNGFKGPNTLGKDIFYIHVTSNGIKPYGTQGDNLLLSCKDDSNGSGCTVQVLLNKDY